MDDDRLVAFFWFLFAVYRACGCAGFIGHERRLSDDARGVVYFVCADNVVTTVLVANDSELFGDGRVPIGAIEGLEGFVVCKVSADVQDGGHKVWGVFRVHV